MSEFNVTIIFDPSPSELAEQGDPILDGVTPGYLIQALVGEHGKNNPDKVELLLPLGQRTVTVTAEEGRMCEMFISYVNKKGVRSKSVRHCFIFGPQVEPMPPSLPRMISTIPVVVIEEEVKQAVASPFGGTPPQKPASGAWIIVSKDGVQASVMSYGDETPEIHVRIDENTSGVLYPDSEVDHVITTSGEKISFAEFLQHVGLPSREAYLETLNAPPAAPPAEIPVTH